MSGSHADAIPLAGAYDGTLGVIGPIAAVAALRKAGFQPRAPIDVLMFTSEEPTRFGLGCIGRCAPAAVSVFPFGITFLMCLQAGVLEMPLHGRRSGLAVAEKCTWRTPQKWEIMFVVGELADGLHLRLLK